MKKALALTLSLLTLASTTLAAGSEHYVEYAPDAWQSSRLALNGVATPSQIFQLPEAIILTGFDLWLDNTGNSGEVTFRILGNADNQIAQKTVTLSQMGAVPGGNKFHVDLDAGVSLAANTPYRIEITSQLSSIGLYYANRITFLEHNLIYTSDYAAAGAARLGTENQAFTFKFALYRQPQGTTYIPPGGPEPATTTITTAITNARVVAFTDTSVTVAWTTNIAADSRLTIRTQINPLYITTSAYDPTLELEHALTITGLSPSINYFADVFSGQGNELLLSTYTIGFRTAAATQNNNQQNNQNQNNTPTSTPPQNNNSNTNQQNTNNNQTTGGPLPSLTFGEGQRSGNFSISWNPPASGEPTFGYRIDIFDSDHNLERRLAAPIGTHRVDVPQLPAGEHVAIVYADSNKVYTKAGPATTFSIKSQVNRRIWYSLIGGFLFLAGSAWFLFWWFAREKSPLPKIEE